MNAAPERTTPHDAKPRRSAAVALPAVLPELLDADTCAALLSVSRRTFYELVSKGQIPPADVRLNSRLVRWRRQSILDAIESLSAHAMAHQ